MTATLVLDSFEELQEVYASIQEDFEAIDYTAFMQRELDSLAALHKSYFDGSKGPDGSPWAANAPSTIKRKGHAVILRGIKGTQPKAVKATKRRPKVSVVRGKNIGGFRLATSLTARTTQSFGDAIREAVDEGNGAYLKFGTSVEYAVYNDQGTGRIPARPHIGMDGKHLDGIVNRVADYALKQLKG